MYFIIIEPVYSQGVGNYIMLTDNVENIDKFRLQLFNYKNYVKTIDDVEEWEFYEYVYKVTDVKRIKKDHIYEGILLLQNCHHGDYDYQEHTYDQNDNLKSEVIYENNKKLKMNYVYNNIDNSKKPCHINIFDILI